MKNKLNPGILLPRNVKKIFLIMKITLFLILASAISLQASSVFSQNKTMTVDMRNVTVHEVINEIEKQGGVSFLFNANLQELNRYVSVSFVDHPVQDVLYSALDQVNMMYEEVGENFLVLLPKPDNLKQQEITVTGRVTDAETDEALPGVTVVIQATTIGTVTNKDGYYEIDVPNQDAVLAFSYVGHLSREMVVGDRTTINVELPVDYIGIEEVVAIGYGTTTKRKLVSSIASMETTEIQEVPYSNVIQGMTGRVSGLFSREFGGKYGSLPQISIRGGDEPLYVIDGVVSSKREFANIPPQDIETISILKDASATSVYGMNAADGIVLVSTKRGDIGELSVTYNGNISFQQPSILPRYQSSYEYRSYLNKASFYDGSPIPYSDEELELWRTGEDPVNYVNYHPQDILLRNFARQNNHNISLNGAVGSTRVYMSTNYFDQGSIIKTGDWGEKRYSFRSNISHKMDDIGLTTTGNVSLQRREVYDVLAGDVRYGAIFGRYRPGEILYTPEGRPLNMGQNVIAEFTEESGYNKIKEDLISGRLEFDWDIPWIEGLNFKTLGNIRYNNNSGKDWAASVRRMGQVYHWDETPADMGYAELSQYMNTGNNYTLESHLNYIKTIAEKHTMELTGVYSRREYFTENLSASRTRFVSSAVDQLFAGSFEGLNNSGNASESGRVGYIGRLKYDYDGKYIIEGSFRYDGNDNFPDEKRWGFFPAGSVGWNIHDEPFAYDILKIIRMTSLKLRASYGVTGTDAGVARFGYIPRYSLINNVYYAGGTWLTGFREGNLVSDDISWYTRTQSNVGVDFGFFEGKISGTFDVFYNRTTGYLGSPSVDYITPLGKSLPQIKTNSAHRRGGVEFMANYHANIGEVNINVGGNISYFDELWERRYDEDSVILKNPNQRTTHQTRYLTVGYQNVGSNGIYNSIDEVINNPRRMDASELQAGDLWFNDVNGDGMIDNNDQIRIGKGSFPHILYGVFFNTKYRGWNLDALFQGTSNRQLLKITEHQTYDIHLDAWAPDNKDPQFSRYSLDQQRNGSNNLQTSEFSVIDAWYLRLRAVNLGYDLKYSLLPNWNVLSEISALNIVFSGTNLFLISPAKKFHIDPETANTINRGYPVNRTFNIGLRATF